MSDCAPKRFSEKEEFQILSRQSDLGKSSYRKHSLWMAHWKRASSSVEPVSGKSCSPFEEISNVGYSKDCGSLPFEVTKARMAERLMLGASNAGASAGNAQQFSSKMWGVTHNVCQGVESKNADPIHRSFDSTMMQKNVNLYAADTVVSERFSVHKISDISMNSCKVLSSENLSSEWNHFPMFEINRKIDSILNPRHSPFTTSPDKSFVSQRALKVNMSTSNVMTFSSKEYEFHSQQVTDKNNSKHKSVGGILSNQDSHIGLNSDHVGRKLKGHSIEESCSCSKNETNSSCSLKDKRSENNFMNPEGLSRFSSENKFMFSASREENENVQGTLQEKKLGASGGWPKEPDFERVASHQQVLGSEYEMKLVNPSVRSEENGEETSHCGIVSFDLLQSERENPTINRVDSALKLTESCKLPDTIENTMAVNSKGETQADRKPPNDKLTSDKKTTPCLFEMLTVPSKSQATCFKDPTSLGGFCGDMTSLLGAQKHFSAKSDSLNMRHTTGIAGTSTQKDSDWPNMEETSTSSIRRVASNGEGNLPFNLSAENNNSFSKATCTSKQEWSRSKTSSMNIDLVLYKIRRMRNPISSALIESPVCSEPSDKWLKRLWHDDSDPYFLCAKRSKLGDDPASGGACTVFGQYLGCDLGKASMINHVEEDEPGYGRLTNQQNREGSPVSSKCLNRWIGRWCQGGTPHFHATSNVGKQTPKSNMQSDDLEGLFPSIAAMAMMGRVMNKLRPRELQRRGPSVVWKTQGL
ncbi:hypothetical protein PR202_gb05154 [Eleusine coracana subsp. coracana]|uniref:Uncharacterized protein n=1 Tax=Eleusine coracana subsp. coracana TaxID=191504 RepID=A0AAV5E611_ELECO|nr:hypothetical protein PR202_gb05154 [Eleusine coracana subsp. coracana]